MQNLPNNLQIAASGIAPPAPPPGREPFEGQLSPTEGTFTVTTTPEQAFLAVQTMARFGQVFAGFMLVRTAESYRFYRVTGMDTNDHGMPRLLLDAESVMDPIRLAQGLNRILQNEGRVCEGFGTCTCRGCNSSYAAWAVADAYIRGDEESLWPDDQVRPRTMDTQQIDSPKPFWPCVGGEQPMVSSTPEPGGKTDPAPDYERPPVDPGQTPMPAPGGTPSGDRPPTPGPTDPGTPPPNWEDPRQREQFHPEPNTPASPPPGWQDPSERERFHPDTAPDTGPAPTPRG